MRKILYFSVVVASLLCSCVREENYTDTPRDNFEALWKVMDEHYCFFDYKKATLGVDWNDVHARYSAQVNDKMTRLQEFEFLGNMIGELRDGHVNLSASFDLSRNWSWKEAYPANFSDTLQRHYLGTDYHIAAGMKYRVLDDNVGYVYCGSFEHGIGNANLEDMLYILAPCNGLIIDVRENGGGMLTSAEMLAGRFTNKDVLVGYMQHKTGPGHNDFSAREERWLAPAKAIRWQKPVVVLTNRGVYSAANDFVMMMKAVGAVIVGDRTGGGGGMPFSSELPNGWAVRFSACPSYDSKGNSIEHGIDPDYKVDITDDDFKKNKDTILEFARSLINTTPT